jgi:hypothetical protein
MNKCCFFSLTAGIIVSIDGKQESLKKRLRSGRIRQFLIFFFSTTTEKTTSGNALCAKQYLRCTSQLTFAKHTLLGVRCPKQNCVSLPNA